MSNTKQMTASVAAFGWPPIMRMDVACRYTCRSRWTLQRAVQSGELVAAGRNKRSTTFLRSDLDRWLLGPQVKPAEREPSATRGRSSTGGDALARIASLRKANP